jgi:hypothetical protein
MDESWMLPKEALEFVIDHVEPGSVVVEFGSGHGSEVLSKHFDLYSFEHDEAWLGVTSSTYIHAPIVENQHATEEGEKGWYDLEIVKQNWPKDPQCVIVDGPPGFIGRTGILSMLEELASVLLILVDDVDREAELQLSHMLSTRLDRIQTTYDVEKPRQGGSNRRFATLTRRQ